LIFEAPHIKEISLPILLKKEDCEIIHGVINSRHLKLKDVDLSVQLGSGCTLDDVGLMVKRLI